MKIRSLFNHRKWLILFANSKIAKRINDKTYLKIRYYAFIGKKLNIENPKTYNEKLQWLKLYDRKPIYTIMVDKFAVKQFVSNVIGEKYIIPTLGVWNSFEEIDFQSLPNQFVLKCTHDSGGLVICKNKNELDMQYAKKKIEKSLKRDYYSVHREWPYKNVKPRIIAEMYMEDSKTSELRDYKFFCFDGKVRAMFVATDRQKEGSEVKFDFFDRDFKHLEFKQGHPNAYILPEKPECFDEMIFLAEKLSTGIPHVRVDFYEVNGRVYFGELTFSHFAGLVPFEPEEWDYTFGEWIRLPKK
ncbi:ATP-grasp fold amidoligase family protein [Faecalitalea cylindroides]|uniref:ATP-grasp fold amidoligase family protein n=1 Tax=Faecalitalea cylindroides TaxID=39483 RepID=UPI000B387684|nr:ATP-grasp fold amidoligase family protein [Faecalitalea cylindroides]OUN60896.1 glycosyl transferase [Faecalitalea cylindroides]